MQKPATTTNPHQGIARLTYPGRKRPPSSALKVPGVIHATMTPHPGTLLVCFCRRRHSVILPSGPTPSPRHRPLRNKQGPELVGSVSGGLSGGDKQFVSPETPFAAVDGFEAMNIVIVLWYRAGMSIRDLSIFYWKAAASLMYTRGHLLVMKWEEAELCGVHKTMRQESRGSWFVSQRDNLTSEKVHITRDLHNTMRRDGRWSRVGL